MSSNRCWGEENAGIWLQSKYTVFSNFQPYKLFTFIYFLCPSSTIGAQLGNAAASAAGSPNPILETGRAGDNSHPYGCLGVG